MMKWLRLALLGLTVVMGVGFALTVPVHAADSTAKDNIKEICKNNPNNSAVCEDLNDPNPEGRMTSTTQNIINLLLFVAGTIAIIVIVVSAIQFSASHGDSNAASKARQNLTYAVVGLVIAISAFAIVNFVLSNLD